MSRLQTARSSEPLRLRGHLVEFSFWPVVKRGRRYEVQRRTYVTDPWPVLAESIAQRCPIRDREAAQAFRGQAEDYYDAATTGRLSAVKPVLLYYSFLNLAKAYIVTTGLRHVLVDPKHGLSEKANLRQIAGAIVRAHPTDRSPSLFDEFHHSLTGRRLSAPHNFRLGHLLAQILPGHRLWCSASDKPERFIAISRILFRHCPLTRSVWTRYL